MKRFWGERIKSARLYNGLTVEELAEKVGVSKQAISQYENNLVELPLEKVFILSNALNFPIDYFTSKHEQSVEIGTTYFRSLLRTNSKARKQQETRLEHLGVIYSFLNQYIDFPALNLPTFDSELTPKEAAIALRKYWRIGSAPIDNITHLLEENGILITLLETSTKDIDAFSQRESINGKEVFFIAVSKESTTNTIIQENKRTTIVLIAVATSESVFFIPHFAKIVVRPAKTADSTAIIIHILNYSSKILFTNSIALCFFSSSTNFSL